MTSTLASWNDGAARQAVDKFVERTVSEDVPVEERVATFDNDGTLWCEKPVPIQADFILRRLFEMAEADSQLRDRQPWKAAYERDHSWLESALVSHYAGDDTNLKMLMAGIIAAHSGISVNDFEAKADSFLQTAQHPTLGRGYLECAYAPMLELLGYLEANGFSNYIASGGGRDFMRPISDQVYGIPRDGVIGSASALEYAGDDHGGTITRKAEADWFDDGPRSQFASGTASAAGHSSLLETRMATSPCSTSAGTRTSPSFVYSSSTTMATASSTTQGWRAGIGEGWHKRLDGREHQGRLGDRLLTLLDNA